ncbi:hypothetical protein DBV23_16105 [Edwardsiella ictaluri]|nr:hypothetical protein DBV23_16105 [Edwardsiella ictaluri]
MEPTHSGSWRTTAAPDPADDPIIIKNNRLHSGYIFWQPVDFSANSESVIQHRMGITLVIVHVPGLVFAPVILQRYEFLLIQMFLL